MTIIRSTLAAAAAGTLALAACTPVDQRTSDPNARTKEGVAGGAATGAALGALIGGDGDYVEGALLGGALGAAAGGAIGQRLDRQASQLRSNFGNDRIEVRNTGEELVVVMPQDILFEVDSAVVGANLQRDLRVLAGSLQDFSNSTVQVIGHTDSTGAASYNRDLSERRAGSVARVLTRAGVSNRRIAAIGRGENDPVASNRTERGRAQNRRVEIVITPRRR